MKGYKIGIDPDTLEFVLIELEVPEEYPGAIVYEYLLSYQTDPAVIFLNSHGRYLINVVRQYRANVARVIDIRKIRDGVVKHVDSAFSLYDQTFGYHSGEIIYPKSFDLDRTKMCTDGIHFFETAADARTYVKNPWVRTRYLTARRRRYKYILEEDAE